MDNNKLELDNLKITLGKKQMGKAIQYSIQYNTIHKDFVGIETIVILYSARLSLISSMNQIYRRDCRMRLTVCLNRLMSSLSHILCDAISIKY